MRLRSHRRSADESRSHRVGPDGRQYFKTAWDRSRAAAQQTTRWRDFIRAHMDVLIGTDFFTVEVLTLKGLMTYYVLFFIHLETGRDCLAGITPCPDQQWIEQQARNETMKDWGPSGAQPLSVARS